MGHGVSTSKLSSSGNRKGKDEIVTVPLGSLSGKLRIYQHCETGDCIVLVDQDMSAVEGVDSSSRSSWVRLEVSRLQNNYLTALTTTTTFERPIEGGANVSEHKAHAQGAESRQQKTPARPGNPAASLQAEAKGPIDRHGAAGPAQEKKTSDGDFELKSSLETVNAAIRPSVLMLTQHSHQQMNSLLSRAMATFDDQMHLDNKALQLLKSVIDLSTDSYDGKRIKKMEAEISSTIQRYAEVKSQSGSSGGTAAQIETRGMQALTDSLEHLKAKKALLKDHFQPVLSITDFKILRLLNEGAFAKVYLAQRRGDSSHQYFAIKVMEKKFIKQQDMVKRVKRECKVMKSTGSNQDMFVRLHCSMQTRNYLFIVMEYVRGGDFLTQLAKHGKFPENIARFYIAELCLAVAYLHDHGVVHRDIKLDNILLTDRGHLKLMDFGMVTPSNSLLDRKSNLLSGEDGANNGWIQSLSFTGTAGHRSEEQSSASFNYNDNVGQLKSVVGNYHYASPEVVLELGYDHAVDWWSCGILFFQFLTGTTPFMAKTAERTVDNIAEYRINWKAVPDYVSQGARDLISGLLAYSAKDRLGSSRSQDVLNHPFFAGINFDTIYSEQGLLFASGLKEAKGGSDDMAEMKEDFMTDLPENKNDEFESFCIENLR